MVSLILLILFSGLSDPHTVELQVIDRVLNLNPVSSQNALSQQSVTAIIQDHDDQIWIGTREGLNRFDGYQYVHFLHKTGDHHSLNDNEVQDLYLTSGGDLYILTRTMLHRLNPEELHFERLFGGAEYNFSGMKLHVLASNEAWIYSETVIYRYGIQDERSDHLTLKESSVPENWTYLISKGNDEIGICVRANGSGYRIIWDGTELKKNRVEDLAACQWDQRLNKTFQKLEVESELPVDMIADFKYQNASLEFAVDYRGNVWFRNHQALFRYQHESHTIERITLKGEDPLRRQAQKISTDRFGGVWMGTLNGLYYYQAGLQPFELYQHLVNDPLTIRNNLISVIHRGPDALIYAGSIGGGLHLLNKNGQVVKHFDEGDVENGKLSNNVVWDIEGGGDGTLWIATDHGITVLDAVSGTGKLIGVEDGREYRGAGSTTYTALEKGCDGEIWAGNYVNGLHRFSMIGEEIHQKNLNWNASAGINSVLSLEKNADCKIWVGTWQDGLFLFDSALGQFLRVDLDPDNPVSAVYDIHEVESGKAMVATARGLFRVDVNSGTVRDIFMEHGLPGKTVYAIERDLSGRWWLSTNYGLIKYRPDTKELIEITTSYGLPAREFVRSSSWLDDDGTLYFGSMDGLLQFHPDHLNVEVSVPSVRIVEFRKTGRDGLQSKAVYSGLEPVLNRHDYSATFVFSAINYITPFENRYRYRLHPHELEWSEPLFTREVTYLNIPPGEYRFEVQVSTGRDQWSEASFIKLTMLPPFWQQTWFYLLVLGITGFVLYGIHKIRVQQLLGVERMRTQIASDLHDEVGGNLSSIKLLTEILKRGDGLAGEQLRKVETIGQASSRTIDAMSDIVWAINPENDRMEDLYFRIKEIVNHMLVGINYKLKLDESIKDLEIDPMFKRDFILIFKESINNIVKHSEANQVQVALQEKGGVLTLAIRDNGTGFETDGVKTGMGISNMKRRSERMNGVVRIDSEKGKGTEITLCVNIT